MELRSRKVKQKAARQQPHARYSRIQHKGRPIRVFYAFDPRRVAILLIGDDKTDDGRFYKKSVPILDELYYMHVADLKRRKLIK